MKKSIVIILILALIVSLCACSQDKTEPQGMTPGSAYVDEIFQTWNTLETYNELVKDKDLPDNFIYYDDLESLGEFRQFHWYRRYMESGEMRLMNATYWLMDANDCIRLVQITYVPIYETKYGETLAFDETVKDMRTYPAEVSGTVYRDEIKYGIRYMYRKGELHYIVLKIEELEITISGVGENATLAKYPISDKNTLLDQLLSADLAVATAAVEELAAKLAQ